MTKRSSLAGLATATTTDDDDTVTDWCADDPTGSIAVVHERLASTGSAPAPLAGPVLDGAVSATVLERVDGLMQQMRHDLQGGHHLEAAALLRERLAACRIELEDAQIEALAEELRDVDHSRARREAAEPEDAEAEDAAAAPATSSA
ncbi:hypothetical protein OVN20_08805 [Microcella daejeonensis]|uniref:hypothetical protein n=1 Tax=Microcella daejeonensis TaxID=2994971 RepID=UPI00226EFFD8|nr:hypothetical protein [Microcella daejeonensis]WAB83187.1 hypothetical protein OVN20_08805 [Microcella daejeonensis]